ncbi:MAG: hypothetical protein KJO69_02555 [Gammaproteobacteria bacterium]|nr:hypothetical protein [Gammaproteobacteria bacterium]
MKHTIADSIKAYEDQLISELALRSTDENRISMLKYEISVMSKNEPRQILKDMYVLVAEKYLIEIENNA